MSGRKMKRGPLVLDSDSDVENQPPSTDTAAEASPKEDIRLEMQRDDSFDLSIFRSEEDETSIEEKSAEISDDEIDNLPDIDSTPITVSTSRSRVPAAVVLPSKKTPIAIVQPTARIVPPSPQGKGVVPSQSAPVSLALVTSHGQTTHTASSSRTATPSLCVKPSTSTALVRGNPSPAGRLALHNQTSYSSSHTAPPSVGAVSPSSPKPSTSKEVPDVNRKRQHSIAIFDTANENYKKIRLDASTDSEADISELELGSDRDFYDGDIDNFDTEPDMDSDEEANLTRSNDIMPFPRQGEDINFDVSRLSHLPEHGFNVNALGDKTYAEFLRQKALTTECIEELYNSLKESLNEQLEEADPRGLTVHLMPHQKQALKWMKWREKRKPSGGILADDMGLGKTLQIISLVLAEKNERIQASNEDDDCDSDDEDWGFSKPKKVYDGKTLVVCLASLVKQWEKEVLTKCKRDHLRVYVYHGTTRQISEARLAKYDIVITTYNLVMREYKLDVVPKKNKDSRIFNIHWHRVVLDEAHFIRNYRSKMSVAACELRANTRWALTGTPIQNKEADFYALLKFLKCSPFDEINVWKKWVSNRSAEGNKRLIVITKSLMLRRTKKELHAQNLIQQLPDKTVTTIKIELDKEERMAYQKLLLYSQSFFFEFLRQKKDKEHLREFNCHMRPNLIAREVPDKITKMLKLLMKHHKEVGTHYILVLILRLRQMCCHPALIKAMLDEQDLQAEGIDVTNKENSNTNLLAELNKVLDEEDDEEDDCDIDASMAKRVMSHANPVFSNTRKSSKVKQILKTVNTILDKGEKVIIVSQWTSFLKVIGNNLRYVNGVRFATFSGSVNVKERQLMVERLNDPNDNLNVLLLSLTAGGVGLNLVGANNLLLIDLHWNPQLETQAQDRIYRFGQESNVHIYKFICVDTIEEKIKGLQDEKLNIAKMVLGGKISNSLTIEDLKLLFS